MGKVGFVAITMPTVPGTILSLAEIHPLNVDGKFYILGQSYIKAISFPKKKALRMKLREKREDSSCFLIKEFYLSFLLDKNQPNNWLYVISVTSISKRRITKKKKMPVKQVLCKWFFSISFISTGLIRKQVIRHVQIFSCLWTKAMSLLGLIYRQIPLSDSNCIHHTEMVLFGWEFFWIKHYCPYRNAFIHLVCTFMLIKPNKVPPFSPLLKYTKISLIIYIYEESFEWSATKSLIDLFTAKIPSLLLLKRLKASKLIYHI